MIASILSEFWQLSPLAKVSFLAGLAGVPIISSIVAFTRIGRANKIIEGLKAYIIEVESQKRQSENETASLKVALEDLTPSSVHAKINGEIKSNNFSKLDTEIEKARLALKDWKQVAYRIAFYDIAMIYGTDMQRNAARAYMSASIAEHLGSRDLDSDTLRALSEIFEKSDENQWPQLSEKWNSPDIGHRILAKDGLHIHQKLINSSLRPLASPLCTRLYQIASVSKEMNGHDKRYITLAYLNTLETSDQTEELELLIDDELAKLEGHMLPPDFADYKTWLRKKKADRLTAKGEHQQAKEIYAEVIPSLELMLGSGNEEIDTVRTRELDCRVRSGADCRDEASAWVDQISERHGSSTVLIQYALDVSLRAHEQRDDFSAALEIAHSIKTFVDSKDEFYRERFKGVEDKIEELTTIIESLESK